MEITQDQSAIEQLIFAYSDAFNSKNISKTVALYTSNGILMANNAPSAEGTAQLTASFDYLLKNFQITIQYVVDEVLVSGEFAYVRTNSEVNTTVKASGEQIVLENKELFVLRKQNGIWKISHYIFNNTTRKK